MGNYHHLSYDNRLLLKQMLDNKCSVKEIAEKLGVHTATVYREIKRFENASQYNPEIAQYSSRNIVLRDGKIREDVQNTNIMDASAALAALPKQQDD